MLGVWDVWYRQARDADLRRYQAQHAGQSSPYASSTPSQSTAGGKPTAIYALVASRPDGSGRRLLYIGKSVAPTLREFQHKHPRKPRPARLQRTIGRAEADGLVWRLEVQREGLSPEQAADTERRLIQQLRPPGNTEFLFDWPTLRGLPRNWAA